MATFEYNALTQAGRAMKGTIEAGSTEEAHQLLEQMQLTINSIEEAKPQKPKRPIGRSEFMLFNQQLASITKAGIPLERGLRELSKDIASNKMRKLIDSVADDLEAGTDIEQAFEKRQKHFPPLYGKILKAGVETGRLSDMLTSLNRHIEVTNRTRRIVFEAFAYPAVILALAAIILTFVFMFIIPAFEEVLFEMVQGQLNPLTTFYFNLATNVVPFWISAAVIIGVITIIFLWLSTFTEGRRFKESIFLKIPVFGRLYHSSIMSKMSEAMAMMVAAGSDMPSCLRLSANASSSDKLALEADTLAQQVEKGNNILEAGQFCKTIPRLFLYSIQLGSQRNELQDNLYSLAQMYKEQAFSGQAKLQSFMLPTMIIFIGFVIGSAVMAMFLPMVQVVTGLSSGGM
ncbi:MAG: type II secretion system F family protein [Planctomycetota bacterium]|jgi:type II secretory pathway component PulF